MTTRTISRGLGWRSGNLTFDGVQQYTYDPWNRLVKIAKAYEDSGGTVQTGSTIMQAEYDGQGRRIVKAVQNSGDLDATYNYYYRGQSAIEIRNGSAQVLKQNVWGLTYIDELVEVGLNDDPADATEDNVESFYYAMQDANFNVMGVVDSTGVLQERYEYTPYGKRTVYISPGTNDPDAYAPTTRSRRWTVSSVEQPYGLNSFGHQGLMHDEESGLIYNRGRMLTNGRFLQPDPVGYVDGMSLYQYLGSSPISTHDSTGLTPDAEGYEPCATCLNEQGRMCCKVYGPRWKTTLGYNTRQDCLNAYKNAHGFGMAGLWAKLGLFGGTLANTWWGGPAWIGGLGAAGGGFLLGHGFGTAIGASIYCDTKECGKGGSWKCMDESPTFWGNLTGNGCTKCNDWQCR